uniref:DnaJ homologue subfamily C GRV2/DNAJC13 N-terminal domain-containing protein n=1 Tax=Ditylenchus dipsaci TaxID=166011 RepID=A0A915DGK4_9BILA
MKATFCADNQDLCCFLVTKLSAWKGKYRRIFSVGTLAITTYNPQTLEITNQWLYEDFLCIKLTDRIKHSNSDGSLRGEDNFSIQIRKKGKVDVMRFCSEYAREVVTETLKFHKKFGSDSSHQQRPKYDCFKHSWKDERVAVNLEVSAASLDQVESQSKVLLKSYPYKDMKQIIHVKDYPGAFVLEVGEQRRRHMFVSNALASLLKDVRDFSTEYLGVEIHMAKDTLTLKDFMLTRLGLCSKDEQLTPYVDFKVQKYTAKSLETAVRRLVCLSETCLIERDPASYSVICARPLKTIVCLVRDLKDPQKFQIEYENGDERSYTSNERDSLLASLIDGSRGSGNYQVFVTSRKFEKALRILPFNQTLDEDGEALLMRHICNVPPGLKRSDMIRRFNANIPTMLVLLHTIRGLQLDFQGFFTDNKNRSIVNCLEAVLLESYTTSSFTTTTSSNNYATAVDTVNPFATTVNTNNNSIRNGLKLEDSSLEAIYKMEAQLGCLHRLFASKSGFQAFTAVNGVRENWNTGGVSAQEEQ